MFDEELRKKILELEGRIEKIENEITEPISKEEIDKIIAEI